MKKYQFTIHGNKYDVHIVNVDENIIELEVNGSNYKVEVDKAIQPVKTPKLVRPKAVPSTDTTPSTSTGIKTSGTSSGAGAVSSPLPGTVIKIHVNVGDEVKVGQKLITLEAMKMENSLDSDKDGKVTAVKVQQGQSVMEGDVLLEIGD